MKRIGTERENILALIRSVSGDTASLIIVFIFSPGKLARLATECERMFHSFLVHTLDARPSSLSHAQRAHIEFVEIKCARKERTKKRRKTYRSFVKCECRLVECFHLMILNRYNILFSALRHENCRPTDTNNHFVSFHSISKASQLICLFVFISPLDDTKRRWFFLFKPRLHRLFILANYSNANANDDLFQAHLLLNEFPTERILWSIEREYFFSCIFSTFQIANPYQPDEHTQTLWVGGVIDAHVCSIVFVGFFRKHHEIRVRGAGAK